MNTRSLGFRLTLWHTLLLLVMALTFTAYTYIGLRHYLVDWLQVNLARRAQDIAQNLIAPLDSARLSDLVAEVKTLYAPEANNRFIRISHNGEVMYLSGPPRNGSFDPAQVLVFHDGMPATRQEPALNGNSIYIVAIPAVAKKNNTRYLVEVGTSDAPIRNALDGLMATLLLGFPVLILLAAGGGYLLVWRSLRPVSDMIRCAETLSQNSLNQRLPVPPTGDQLENLSRTLNRMIDRLDAACSQNLRFTADASHELRTPLTVMRGELESIVDTSSLPRHLRERIGSVLEETERLSRITEGLLTIARLDSGETPIERVNFDLGKLVATTTDQMLLLAEDKHIEVHVQAPPIIIPGDPARMKQVIVNLFDNAIKYTPQGGRIDIEVRQETDAVILSVKDNGIGIDEEALPHVFERFYRADKVRSRGLGGTGLGLAIVRAICTRHGGSVEVLSIATRGSQFIVKLPLAWPLN
ncbi:MAG: ATP-binding protein [Pseudomonadota bacterium]